MKDEKIEELEKFVLDLKNNWKLALADAENIKKIAQRGVSRFKRYILQV